MAVQLGHHVLLRLANNSLKTVQIQEKGQVSLGKQAVFQTALLIGQLYGSTLELAADGSLTRKEDVPIVAVDDTDATNENIAMDANAQGLTTEEILALKAEGADGRAIIAKQIEEHAAFALKNEYSKSKYIARKESKYLKYFTILSPTTHNICQSEFQASSVSGGSKINDLRPDTLSNILNMADIRPGSRVICVEDTSGLLIGAILSRMNGEGSLLVIHDKDSPPAAHLLSLFNLTDAQQRPYQWLHWAAADQAYNPPIAHVDEEPPSAKKAEKDKRKAEKRKLQDAAVQSKRQDLFDGEWDALVISSHTTADSIVDFLSPYLGGSANLVIHAPLIDPLTKMQNQLHADHSWIACHLVEPQLRRYQVLPGRTHPEMNGTATAGYILHAIRVIVDDTTQPIVPGNRKRKR